MSPLPSVLIIYRLQTNIFALETATHEIEDCSLFSLSIASSVRKYGDKKELLRKENVLHQDKEQVNIG